MQGRAELAIVTLAPVREASVVTLPIWPDPLDFMVGIHHPLAQHTGLDLRALSEHPPFYPASIPTPARLWPRLF